MFFILYVKFSGNNSNKSTKICNLTFLDVMVNNYRT